MFVWLRSLLYILFGEELIARELADIAMPRVPLLRQQMSPVLERHGCTHREQDRADNDANDCTHATVRTPSRTVRMSERLIE